MSSCISTGRVATLSVIAMAIMVASGAGDQRLAAQQRETGAAEIPDIEGGWVRIDAAGSGSFGGLTSGFTPAVLTPEAAAALAAAPPPAPRGVAYQENRRHEPGEPYIVVDMPCVGGGGGGVGIIPDSMAIHLVQQKDEVLWAREGLGARHIFMDGRKHPDLSLWTPNPYGHSVGRYESGSLIVETVGLTDGAVPAGGRRTPATRVTEQLTPSADGKRLTIKYTWDDPKIYQKPHSFEILFDRVPPGGYALENWCDASDPLEKQSTVPPEQR